MPSGHAHSAAEPGYAPKNARSSHVAAPAVKPELEARGLVLSVLARAGTVRQYAPPNPGAHRHAPPPVALV